MLEAIDPASPLEAVLFVRTTGAPLATWVRNGGSPGPLAVMSAAMFASVETIVQAVGGRSPSLVCAEGSGYRILALQVESRAILVVVAPQTVEKSKLRREAHRILGRFRALREKMETASPPTLRMR